VSADDDTEQQTDEPTADVETAADVEPTAGVEIDSDEGRDEGSGVRGRRGLSVGALPAIPVIPLVLVLALLAAGGLAAWLYFTQYRPDEQSDSAVAKSAVDAARNGTVAMLSYKPDTLDQDFATAKSHLTGDFLTYYDKFTRQIVTPAAKEKAVTTTAQVVGAAASEVRPNSVVVLVFVNQVTTSRERPDPAMASSSVLVSLTNVHGTWLITKFDPV
jgi:Mce-associated membrane protein